MNSLKESESEVAQSCPTLSDPMDCSLPGSSVHGICQAMEYYYSAIKKNEVLMHATIWMALENTILS